MMTDDCSAHHVSWLTRRRVSGGGVHPLRPEAAPTSVAEGARRFRPGVGSVELPDEPQDVIGTNDQGRTPAKDEQVNRRNLRIEMREHLHPGRIVSPSLQAAAREMKSNNGSGKSDKDRARSDCTPSTAAADTGCRSPLDTEQPPGSDHN